MPETPNTARAAQLPQGQAEGDAELEKIIRSVITEHPYEIKGGWKLTSSLQSALSATIAHLRAQLDITQNVLGGSLYSARKALEDRAINAETELEQLRPQLDEAQKIIEHLQESLREQAMARIDLTAPLLKPEMVEKLREASEVQYALAEGQDDRIEAHALALLCDWQDQIRAGKLLTAEVI
jgi:predicted RNase H-like nuclease (RuvC/YqgF family)